MSVEAGSSFGALLRRYRKAAGLTQEELAERALLSVYTVSALERGTNHAPRKDTLALLAEALGLDAAERAALEAAARSHVPPSVPASPAPPIVPLPVAHPTGPLVGRAVELATLERHLAGDGPPVLLLAGEPGIGKSRLLQEAQARAHAAGWTVLTGGCQRGGGQDSYAPLTGALEGRLRRVAPAQARAELEGCAWLARLLPEVVELGAEPLPGWILAPPQERRLVVRAAERYARNVAGPAGTLLVLDDVQWAGADGLEVLAALLESAEEIPLRVVAAYRSTEAPPDEPLGALVADLLSKGRAARRALLPLPPEEAGELIDTLLAGRPVLAEDRAEVVRRAEGLPFFLVSCVEGLAAGGPGVRVPESVSQSIRQRVAMLPTAAQEVLRAAAVVGRAVERSLLTAALEQPRAQILAALEAACLEHLLEEEGSGAYRFAHDLVRDVVEGDLSAGRRAALHQVVAEALEARGGAPDLELLAYHYCRSDAADKALEYLEKAGDHARATGANIAAESYYRDLVQRLESLGRRGEAAHVYARLGSHLDFTYHHAEAQAAYLRCFDLYAATASGSAALAAGAESQAFMALIEREPEHTRGALYLAYARLLEGQHRSDDCPPVYERAADLARRRGDTRFLAEVLHQYAALLWIMGPLQASLVPLHESRLLCEANGYLGQLVQVLLTLQIVHHLAGERDQVGVECARCIEVAEQIGDPDLLALAVFAHMWYAFYTGDWERAHADLVRSIEIAPHFAHNENLLINKGTLLMAQGAWSDAAEVLEQAGAGPWQQCVLAELDLLQERPADALARVQPLLERGEGAGPGGAARQLSLAAWAQFQLGHLDEAAATVRQAVARAAAEGAYAALPDALRIQALVAMERREWAEAERALEEGIVLARRTRNPYVEAHLLQVYGQLHLRIGEGVPAQARLQEALAIFQRLGARMDVERVEQQLADPARSLV